jgi:hypothetical protein
MCGTWTHDPDVQMVHDIAATVIDINAKVSLRLIN